MQQAIIRDKCCHLGLMEPHSRNQQKQCLQSSDGFSPSRYKEVSERNGARHVIKRFHVVVIISILLAMPSMDEHSVSARNGKKNPRIGFQSSNTDKYKISAYQSCLDERIKQNKSLPKTVSLATADSLLLAVKQFFPIPGSIQNLL